MNAFPIILKELMEDKPIDVKTLAEHLGLAYPSIIYEWLKGEKSLLLSTAIKVADFFNCSLDYLFGRSDEYNKGDYKICPSFDLKFREVLKEQKVSQNKLTKDKIISRGSLNSWLNKKQTPHIESVIKLAAYLNVSIDYFVGRE